ncbi:MAG: hypothetical protein NC407_14695, partial [Lachnoclostridium sp.]|nr:hypothetical protein [Lachnoclostridium sp.]
KINGSKIKDYEDIQTKIAIEGGKSKLKMTILKENEQIKTVNIKPKYNKKDKMYYYKDWKITAEDLEEERRLR